MTTEELRHVRDAQPFAPFALRMADGRSLTVPHPEFLAIPPQGRIAVLFRPEGGLNLVDVMLVTDIEIPTATTAREANGGEASPT